MTPASLIKNWYSVVVLSSTVMLSASRSNLKKIPGTPRPCSTTRE